MSERIRLSTDEQDPKYRLRIEDDGQLFELADEALTSASPRAQPVRGKRAAVYMTEEEARWLHGALGELLDERKAGEQA